MTSGPSITAPEWVAPAVKENLSDQAYSAVRSALMRGQLAPGETLSLRPTAKLFSISVTPMREALLRLVSEHALETTPRGSIVVPRLELAHILEIHAIRMELEGNAAASAASLVQRSDIARLEELHHQMIEAKAAGLQRESLGWNAEFHLLLCRLGQMPISYEIVESLWVRCGPTLTRLVKYGLENWEPHPHLELLEALKNGDGESSRLAIRRDIDMGRTAISEMVTPDIAS